MGSAPATVQDMNPGPAVDRQDLDTLTKLLAQKTNEAAEAKAQLADLRDTR